MTVAVAGPFINGSTVVPDIRSRRSRIFGNRCVAPRLFQLFEPMGILYECPYVACGSDAVAV